MYIDIMCMCSVMQKGLVRVWYDVEYYDADVVVLMLSTRVLVLLSKKSMFVSQISQI